MKSGTPPPPLRATRLLDQVRERLRYGHYSLSTERSYVYWVRWFVRFHRLRHPRDMGAAEVEAFLSWLANRRGASVSTHKQALSALVFLYRQVLRADLPWLQEIGRPRTPQRLPVRHEQGGSAAAAGGHDWRASARVPPAVRCQGDPKFPQVWESKIPHPVHASASSARTRPALNFSLSRYELPRMLSVTA